MMRFILLFILFFSFGLNTSHSFAEETQTTDIYAVTPENCGKMTLEKCKEAMDWAKAYSAKLKAKSKVHRDNIARMHEEALQVLSEDQKKVE